MTSTRTAVVTTASGTQGAAAARALLRAGWAVRGLTRGRPVPAGVEPVRADLLDAAGLARGLDGADAAVVGLPLQFDPALAQQQADALADALLRAGTPRVVLTPGAALPAGPVGVPFVDVRVRLADRLAAALGSAPVVAPAATYLENLAAPWSAPLVAAGEVAYPLPAAAPVPWVALDDVGACAAAALDDPAAPARTLVAGPAALTGEEVAAQLARALGRPVRWRTATPGEYARMLAPHLGEATAQGVASAYEAPAAGAPAGTVVRTGTTDLLGWARRTWTRVGASR